MVLFVVSTEPGKYEVKHIFKNENIPSGSCIVSVITILFYFNEKTITNRKYTFPCRDLQ